MRIDFSPMERGDKKLLDLAQELTVHDLRAATNTSIDTILDIIKDADDAAVVFVPYDPHADDPYAAGGDASAMPWTLAHQILHVCASAEEGARFSAVLAGGISVGGRLRYEPDWRQFTTRQQIVERLEESRRMRLAYLDAWPNTPHLGMMRELSPRFAEKFGDLNATANVLLGLKHESDHYEQMRQTVAQALVVSRAVSGD